MLRIARVMLIAGAVLGGLARPIQAAEGEVTFGSQWWDQTALEAEFRELREVPRGAFLERFVLTEWSGRTAVRLYGENAVRLDQRANLDLIQGARWRLDLGYSQVPHRFSFAARTPYVETQSGVLQLPDSLQRANQEDPASYASRMLDELGSAAHVPLEFRSDYASGRVRGRFARGWQLDVQAVQRRRDGNKPWGGPFGFNSAIEIPEPIDQRMTEADAFLSFDRDRLSVRGSVGVSQFDNRVSTLVWDNPKRITDRTGPGFYVGGDGSVLGRMDLYPDNESVRGGLALALRLPRSTALHASLQVSRFTQDDDLLPYTINTAILQSNPDSLPATSAEAEATRLTGDYRLTARPLPALSATLRMRHESYENDTPERLFTGRVRMDQTFIAEPGRNKALDFGRVSYGLDADYDVARPLRIGATVERRSYDRTHREVEDNDETILGGRARLRPGLGLVLQLDYRRAEREMDEFHLDEYRKMQQPDSALVEQPDLRRYDVADRTQDLARARVGFPLGDQVQLSAGYELLRNDYDAHLGLGKEERHTVSTEAMVALGERLDVTGGVSWQRYDTDQTARESGAALALSDSANWSADIRDDGTFAFVYADWRAAERLGFALEYELSDSRSQFDISRVTGVAANLPDTKFRRHDVRAEARWRWLAATELALRYGFEQYDVEDFGSEGVPLLFPVTGPANAIFLGDSSLDYRSHRVALVATHRF